MWFDIQAAVAKIEADKKTVVTTYPPANPAISATSDHLDTTFASRLAVIAEIAADNPKIPKTVKDTVTGDTLVIRAIRKGNLLHGTVASATVTYQLLDRLIASRKVIQAKDGTLSEGNPQNDPK